MSQYRGLRALTWAFLLETSRSKLALFWNLVFPLVWLVGLSYIFGGGKAAQVARVVPGTITMNLIVASFFGVSLHMVSLREKGLYRRFRVTPINSLTVVMAHSVTALVNILASVALQLVVARILFRMKIHGSFADLAFAVLLAAFAFIPLGLIVGSTAKDMKTAPAISNLMFFPMLFLSGATMPLYLMPPWLQHTATFLPATYVVELMQGVVLRGSAFKGLAASIGILVLTGIIGFVFNALLFRWESREPINRRGLALAVGSLAVVYLVAFATGTKLESARTPEAQSGTARKPGSKAQIFTGMTILDGMGERIERGQLLVEGNRIVEFGAESDSLPEGVPVTNLSGLYLIPGLIDSHIHLGGSAGGSISPDEYVPTRLIHDLQVYLALGITSFVSLTDHVEDLQRLRADVAAGTMRSPRPFFSGPGLTAPGGHPAKLFSFLPGFPEYMTRQVRTPEAAEKAVREVAAMRPAQVDVIKLFLDEGWLEESFPVLPEPALRAAIRTAEELGIRTTVHVDTDRHARLAVDAGARGIEHAPPDLSEETIKAMLAKGVTLTPTLVVSEGMVKVLTEAQINDPLATKWVTEGILDSLQSPDSWIARLRKSPEAVSYYTQRYEQSLDATLRAVAAGVTIVAGSDAGNPATFHGPGLLRELELLVEKGGMTPAAALVAATGGAAKRLGTQEVGRIAPGAFADFVILSADPTKDIRALRDVRAVYFGGALLQRETLLTSFPGNWKPTFSFPTSTSPGQGK